MSSNRASAIAAGTLIVLGMLAGILSVAPSVDDDAYLVAASANANQVMLAAAFQLVMAAAYLGVAVLLYPVLRRYGESLAVGFLGFRIISAAFVLAGAVVLLSLLSLSQAFVKAGAPDPSFFQTLGGLLRTGRDLVNHVAMIVAASLGGLMLNAAFYRSRLVPRWLSGWGLVGAILAMVASALVMFELVEIIAPTYLLLNAPTALQEVVLAGWLVVKGFDRAASAPATLACGS